MSDTVQIGVTDAGERMMLDVPRLVGAHTCVMANAGAGKSGLMRVVFEAVAGRMQTIILDPEDEFYTLRQTQPDLLIAGGEGGDCPATPENAAVLATMLLTHGLSAVVQLNQLRAFDQERFVALFLDAMMAAPSKLWHPVLIGLDEAHRFAPQDGDAASGAAVKDVASRGRKRGFTLLLASQRMAKIDKNVTGDVNNWFMGRVGQATDRRVACEQLGFSPSSPEGRALQSLPTRRFYAMGVALPPVATLFDVRQAKTTILQAGQSKAPTPPPAAAMAGLLKELTAASKAPDGLSNAADPALAAEEREAVFQRGVEAGRAEGREAGVADGRQLGLRDAMIAISRLQEAAPPAVTVAAPTPPPPAAPRAAPRVMPTVDGKLPRAVDDVARFITEVWPKTVTFDEAARRAGVGMKSSQYRSYEPLLIESGLVVALGDGRYRAHPPADISEAQGAATLLARHRAQLSSGYQKVLDAFVGEPTRAFTSKELLVIAGFSPTSSSATAAVKELRDRELIEPAGGGYQLVELFRP